MQVWMVEQGEYSDYSVLAIVATKELAQQIAEVLHYHKVDPSYRRFDSKPLAFAETVASLEEAHAACLVKPHPDIFWKDGDDDDGGMMLYTHQRPSHRSSDGPFETLFQITPMKVLGLAEVVLSPELAQQLRDSQRRIEVGEQPKPWEAVVAEAQTEHCTE